MREKIQANQAAHSCAISVKIHKYFHLSLNAHENTPTMIANAVLDNVSGEMIDYRQLIHHSNPQVKQIWTTSASEEFGRLFQGVGKNTDGTKRVEIESDDYTQVVFFDHITRRKH